MCLIYLTVDEIDILGRCNLDIALRMEMCLFKPVYPDMGGKGDKRAARTKVNEPCMCRLTPPCTW